MSIRHEHMLISVPWKPPQKTALLEPEPFSGQVWINICMIAKERKWQIISFWCIESFLITGRELCVRGCLVRQSKYLKINPNSSWYVNYYCSKFWSEKHFLKEMYTFIELDCIILIKSVSKHIRLGNISVSYKCCCFELSKNPEKKVSTLLSVLFAAAMGYGHSGTRDWLIVYDGDIALALVCDQHRH